MFAIASYWDFNWYHYKLLPVPAYVKKLILAHSIRLVQSNQEVLYAGCIIQTNACISYYKT